MPLLQLFSSQWYYPINWLWAGSLEPDSGAEICTSEVYQEALWEIHLWRSEGATRRQRQELRDDAVTTEASAEPHREPWSWVALPSCSSWGKGPGLWTSWWGVLGYVLILHHWPRSAPIMENFWYLESWQRSAVPTLGPTSPLVLRWLSGWHPTVSNTQVIYNYHLYRTDSLKMVHVVVNHIRIMPLLLTICVTCIRPLIFPNLMVFLCKTVANNALGDNIGKIPPSPLPFCLKVM